MILSYVDKNIHVVLESSKNWTVLKDTFAKKTFF